VSEPTLDGVDPEPGTAAHIVRLRTAWVEALASARGRDARRQLLVDLIETTAVWLAGPPNNRDADDAARIAHGGFADAVYATQADYREALRAGWPEVHRGRNAEVRAEFLAYLFAWCASQPDQLGVEDIRRLIALDQYLRELGAGEAGTVDDWVHDYRAQFEAAHGLSSDDATDPATSPAGDMGPAA